MRKHLLVSLLVTLVAIAWTAPAAAQGNSHGPDSSVGLGADESGLATITKTMTATNNHFAVRYQCTDPTGTASSIAVAIADVGIEGDIWGATIYKGTKTTIFRSIANQSSGPGGAAAFAPGVFSSSVGITTKVKKVDVVATIRSSIPDCSLPWPFCNPGPYTGLPAGASLRITTTVGSLVCDRKQVTGGTATP